MTGGLGTHMRHVVKSLLGEHRARRIGAERQRWLTIWDLAQPRNYLLICSHMRSYSSLLSHLLASADDVSGYAEMRRSYRTEADLMALAWQVRSSHGGRLRGTHVLDKILHNTHVLEDDVLAMSNVQVVVSVRDAEPTLRSIIAMGRLIEPGHFWTDPQNASSYYCDRLATLEDLVIRHPRAVVLEPEGLADNRSSVFRDLAGHLGVEVKAADRFTIQPHTGAAEYGDISSYIRSGVVVTERDPHEEIVLPQASLRNARQAQQRFWTTVDRLERKTIGLGDT